VAAIRRTGTHFGREYPIAAFSVAGLRIVRRKWKEIVSVNENAKKNYLGKSRFAQRHGIRRQHRRLDCGAAETFFAVMMVRSMIVALGVI
jgi:hypothetical protein